MTKNNSTWTYTYNSDGLRTSRTNGVTTYDYVYSGDLLKQMTVTDVASGAKQVLTFTYDATGTPLTLDLDGTVYYYLTNIQGDVTGIVDADGNILIQYVYEGYGKSYFINDTSDLTVTLGSINPLAYRAYVFDMGTALYYLQSRYYDQFLGRFLNADAFVSMGLGFVGNNMFAYCINNPIVFTDSSGMCPYDGTAGDFRRLERGLPPQNCKCISPEKLLADTVERVASTCVSVVNSTELSLGIGLGLQGEADIIDLLGLNLGMHWNLINAEFKDGKFIFSQEYESVASLTVIFFDVGFAETRSDSFWEPGPIETYSGVYGDESLTIISGGAYFFAGGSFRIGFDTVQFFTELDDIWESWWNLYGW